MNYFELYPGDYLRDTPRLSLIEHGAYLKLILAYYGEEMPLPADLGDLYRICAAINPADKGAVRRVAEQFFPVAEDGKRHKNRIDEEIIKARRRIQTARENGAKHQPKKHPPGNPPGMPPGNPAGTQRVTHSGEALHTPLVEAVGFLENNLTPPAVGQPLVDKPEDKTGTFEGHDTPTLPAHPSPVAPFAIAMRRLGFQTTSLNPELIAYVNDGGTLEHLAETCARSDCAGKVANYPLAIARRELAEKAHPVTISPINGSRRPEPPHNPGGVSPRLSAEAELERKVEAMEILRASDPETYAALTGRDSAQPYAPSIAA